MTFQRKNLSKTTATNKPKTASKATTTTKTTQKKNKPLQILKLGGRSCLHPPSCLHQCADSFSCAWRDAYSHGYSEGPRSSPEVTPSSDNPLPCELCTHICIWLQERAKRSNVVKSCLVPAQDEEQVVPQHWACSHRADTGHSMEMKPEARVACQVMLALLFTALFITAIAFAGECRSFSLTVQAFQPHAQPCLQCPLDWIRYRGKCYYFSEAEGNWTSSRENCSALGASLATLDSTEDLSFVMRYKGISEHWIGLLREDEEQPWQWVNSSPLSHLFQIRGGGLCAYLDDNGLSSSHCSTERSWICNKHELQSPGKGNRMRRPPNLCVSSLGAAGRPSHSQISGAP